MNLKNRLTALLFVALVGLEFTVVEARRKRAGNDKPSKRGDSNPSKRRLKGTKESSWLGDEHKFKSAKKVGDGAVRSPCPAINTLANHGFIDRYGMDIDPVTLATHLQAVFGVDKQLHLFLLALALAGLFGSPEKLSFNLDELFAVEKPISLFLKNPDDKRVLYKNKFEDLVDLAGDGTTVLTVADMQHHHLNLIKTMHCEGTIDEAFSAFYLQKIAAETVDTLNAFALATSEDFANLEVNIEDLEYFLDENRFPPGWEPRNVTANPDGLVGNILQYLISADLLATFPQGLQDLYASIDTASAATTQLAVLVGSTAQKLGYAMAFPPTAEECALLTGI